jgi:hypothetical protein
MNYQNTSRRRRDFECGESMTVSTWLSKRPSCIYFLSRIDTSQALKLKRERERMEISKPGRGKYRVCRTGLKGGIVRESILHLVPNEKERLYYKWMKSGSFF